MAGCDISSLPVELRLKILSFLPLYQLKMVVRVNRKWREMGEDAFLWKKLNLVISNKTQSVLTHILKMRRLQKLRRINFCNPVSANQAEDIINAVTSHDSIKELDISFSKLSKVQPDKFGVLVRGLEVLVMHNCRLTYPQMKMMFTVLYDEDTSKLQKLYIGTNDLHQLDPALLARSVPKLSALHCDNTYLLDIQVEAIFHGITQPQSRMRELNIHSVDLSLLSPTLISSMLSRLVSANLWGTLLTQEQLEEIFTVLSTDTKLQHLNLSNNDLSLIPPFILSGSISRLTKAELCHSRLVPMQLTMLLTKVATKDCQLTSLDLTGNPAAVQQLPSQLLDQARDKLVTLELGYF